MKNTDLVKLMHDSALDAVNISAEQFNITLDFSSESIALVDLAINNYLERYKAQALEDKAVFTICNLYGAYVGETFIKLLGGEWMLDDKRKDAPSVFVTIEQKQYAFAGICYEKLVNNNLVSIKQYFDLALSAHQK